jgi:hypothetical protein
MGHIKIASFSAPSCALTLPLGGGRPIPGKGLRVISRDAIAVLAKITHVILRRCIAGLRRHSHPFRALIVVLGTSRLGRDQLDFNFLAKRTSSPIEGSESDRTVVRIEKAMNSGPGGSHFCGQSAFAQLFFLHQVMHFQGHRALERRSLDLFKHSLFSKEIPDTAAAMSVSRLNRL